VGHRLNVGHILAVPQPEKRKKMEWSGRSGICGETLSQGPTSPSSTTGKGKKGEKKRKKKGEGLTWNKSQRPPFIRVKFRNIREVYLPSGGRGSWRGKGKKRVERRGKKKNPIKPDRRPTQTTKQNNRSRRNKGLSESLSVVSAKKKGGLKASGGKGRK